MMNKVIESYPTQKYAVAETGRILNSTRADLAVLSENLEKTVRKNRKVNARENARWNKMNASRLLAPTTQAKKGPNQFQNRKC